MKACGTYVVLIGRKIIITVIMKEATSISWLNIIFGMVADKNVFKTGSFSTRLKIHIHTERISLASLQTKVHLMFNFEKYERMTRGIFVSTQDWFLRRQTRYLHKSSRFALTPILFLANNNINSLELTILWKWAYPEWLFSPK